MPILSRHILQPHGRELKSLSGKSAAVNAYKSQIMSEKVRGLLNDLHKLIRRLTIDGDIGNCSWEVEDGRLGTERIRCSVNMMQGIGPQHDTIISLKLSSKSTCNYQSFPWSVATLV